MVKIEDIAKELRNFGFTKYEAQAYLGLIREGILTAPNLARVSNVPKSKIYDVLEKLTDKRMIEEFPGMPRKFKARTPDFVFDEVLLDGRKRVDELERGAGKIKRQLTDLLSSTERTFLEEEHVLWTVNGRKAFHEKFADMGNKAQKEVLVMSPYFSRNSILERCVMAARRKGVIFKGITSLNEENASRVKFYTNLYSEIRHFDGEIPLTVVIHDKKEMMYRMSYSVRGETNYIGVHSTNPGLVKAFLQYWQALWKVSKGITEKDIDKVMK